MNRVASLAAVILFTIALAGQSQPAGTPAPEPVTPPDQVVARLHDALLESMQSSGSVDDEKRRATLQPVLEATYDLDFVGRSVMRKYWKALDDEQRKRFADTFRELCIGTYVDKFDEYSGQRFEMVGQRRLKRGSVLIQTRLLRPDKDPVQLEYVLVQRGDRWMIVNVVADGVSDLALKRAEYGSVMEKEGFESLLAKLQAKIDAFGA